MDLLQYHELDAAELAPLPLLSADEARLSELLKLAENISAVAGSDRNSQVRLDEACRSLCEAYVASPPMVRAHLRLSVRRELSWALVLFSRRCIQGARATRDAAFVDQALTANAIAGLKHGDVRDTLVTVPELLNVARAVGVDDARAIKKAASLSGIAMRALFLKCLGDDVRLSQSADVLFPALAISPPSSFSVVRSIPEWASRKAIADGYFSRLTLFDSAGVSWPVLACRSRRRGVLARVFSRTVDVDLLLGEPDGDAMVHTVALLCEVIDNTPNGLYTRTLSASELKSRIRQAESPEALIRLAETLTGN